MNSDTIALPPATPGTRRTLTVQRFGTPGARPQVYLQASLHADEIPALLVADKLRRILQAEEAAGRIRGEVVLVPVANPIGLGQSLMGHHVGRFDMEDGKNFNRDYPYLTDAAAERLAGRLTDDADANKAAVRAALAEALAEHSPRTEAEHLKHRLLALAIQADYVLDLHCDLEAVMHLYTLTPSAEAFAPLQRLLGAQAVFLAEESGGDPFDEAVSRPWNELAKRWPDRPIPMGCHSVTVELRGQADVEHAQADADAHAIAGFLTHVGVLSGEPPALPEPLCAPTPLESSEPLVAPVGGVVVFHHKPGDRVEAGAVVADILDPLDGTLTPVRSSSAGVLYAHNATRFTQAGKRIAKIAGTTVRRTGPLLSA
ncbi:succinylglutamate desuccinylase/aspartoacylase family protein [Azospirillum canadense]|uniref:succinylglutamate desuccinylase/aspartoacylase family protein n=1 Tax=Azospirillum canadense TaxID=403962 RepID=UPI00222638C3|nr:succinylglutamate desuccinylase/aspartoacylase family protein [Azospirillum canadense]MCW2244027.1 putative deacylase [Azospirillum canadense]